MQEKLQNNVFHQNQKPVELFFPHIHENNFGQKIADINFTLISQYQGITL